MAAEPANAWGKKWGQIVARAWTEEGFKKRLLADPAAVLKEHGVTVPPGLQVRVMEDTDQVRHLTLPQMPVTDQLSEEDLQLAAGGIIIGIRNK
jgi:hypothetical protein